VLHALSDDCLDALPVVLLCTDLMGTLLHMASPFLPHKHCCNRLIDFELEAHSSVALQSSL